MQHILAHMFLHSATSQKTEDVKLTTYCWVLNFLPICSTWKQYNTTQNLRSVRYVAVLSLRLLNSLRVRHVDARRLNYDILSEHKIVSA